MADYLQDAKDAYADLKESGMEVDLLRNVEVLDPVAGESTLGTPFTMTLTGLLKSPKTFRGNTGYDETLEAAARIGRAKVFYCAAYGLPEVPKIGDMVTIHDIAYKVHAITTLEPGGIAITHNLTLLQV